jgi:1-deoxy-D-xylulose-5-phosphate synthase
MKTMPLLERIHNPADIKALPEAELPQLAEEVRTELIRVLSQTGGHLGPNLGVVELTIALHRVFDTPKDKFVFDVSHQGYVHKLFTGRRERFDTIRQYEGLNGFLLPSESQHDCYGAGHAGTALSAALGMAVGRDLRGGKEHVVCVAGDAAFTCGVSFEALNNVANSTDRLIVVLNDNEWSIAKNVGAIAEYLSRIVTNPAYNHLHDKAAKFVEWIGGKTARKLAGKFEAGMKNLLAPSVIFEDLGLRYYGPIDGHGLGKFEPDTGETAAAPTPTYSELLGRTLSDFADRDNRIVAITAAMPTGTGLVSFAKRHPKRFFDVGIAEEHAALFACGLAAQGMKPFLTIYSTFMQRAYDMVIHDIALQNLDVAICMDRAGLAGDDGPTHHGLFDIGYLRPVPGIVHMQPKDEDEFADMLFTMAHYKGPIAIRYPRGAGTGAKPKAQPKLLEIGQAEVLRHGKQVALIALGNMCQLAEEAADLLKAQGIDAAVINARWIKPLDTTMIEFFARGCEVICTFEDHVLHNGFGCAVMEHLADQHITTPVVRIGWPDEFIEHGSVPILREKHGLTAKAAVEKILAALPARRKASVAPTAA